MKILLHNTVNAKNFVTDIFVQTLYYNNANSQ